MSDTQTSSPAPRRSQRDRKAVQPFVSVAATRKRKRNDSDTEDDAHPENDVDRPESGQDDDEEEEDERYQGPKSKEGLAGKSKPKTSPKAKVSKKPRTEKTTVPKPPKAGTRRGRKPKEGEDAYDADQVAKDTKISADNPLFNAIMNPASPLQSSAEDFLESLQQSPGPALAELINLVLRSCGSNDSVDADQAVDFDGIVSTLDDFTESLKQENSPIYPLTSKLPVFKRFRKSLSEWIERLVISASDLDALYSSQMMETLQQWVVSMSSSQIRSFRHTATVIALEAETALCDVAAAVDKESEVVARQREGEKKRKGSKGGNARLKELEVKSQDIKRRQNKLKTFVKEFVDGVFVHRFRDLDPNIRAECVRALGLWLRKYPEHFLDAHYLRYVGWVLSDANNHVRLEAVKALSGVYDQAEYIPSLTLFTERFKTRLLEMATSDVDLSIRVAVIHVLGDIEGHFPLEEEQKERLCLLLFDEEPKVRKAVSPLVRAVWEEEVEEQINRQHKPSDKDKERIGFKYLASLLVKWGKALDTLAGDTEDSEIGDDTRDGGESITGPSRRANRRREVIALVGAEERGRVALAVEALWDEVDLVGDWEALLDLLLLDHSASEEDSQLISAPTARARANGKKHNDDFLVDDAWRLEENEESILLEVMVAAITRAKEESTGGKKGEEENLSNDITRALIKGLPRLFLKHQSDQNRIAEVLVIPTLMNLDLYLEMRMITAYTGLWDDVIKQFMSHSSAKVLSHAMTAIRYFMDATSLTNSNSTKILELEDELSTQLRDTIAGRDEIEVASFSEDEVLALSAWCTRLAILSGTRNMSSWIEEDEGGKQSSAWDIINALVERGRLGYKEEELMIEQALHVLMLHILWKTKGLTAEADPTPEDIRDKEALKEQRECLLEKLIEYAIGTQSNTVEGVKRAAFKHLVDLHVLFSSTNTFSPDGDPLPIASLALNLDDEVQYRCAGYIQAEIERYADFLDDNAGDNNSQKSNNDGSEEEEDEVAESSSKPSKAHPKKTKRQAADLNSRDLLEREYLFIDVISTFLRAIRAGTIHVQHGAVILAHYGRLEMAFDTCSKVIVDVLRDEIVMKDSPETLVTTLTQALQEAYTLVLDGVVHDESNAVQLAKIVSSCFIVRGSQLVILRRLPTQYILQIQTNLLSWIGKRIAAYENNKNKKSLKSAITFFKVLVPLLGALQSRDALKVKAHMDQVLAEAKVEISPSSKLWEPQRVYEKRLTAIMSKDNAQGPKVKRTRKKVGQAASTEEDTEGERTQDETAAQVHPRPKPRRVTRANPDVPEEGADASGNELGPVTPKARLGPTRRQKTPQTDIEERDDSPLLSVTPSEEQPDIDVTLTPRSSLKRPRDDDGDENNETNAPNGMVDVDPEPAGIPDIQVRRKRIRH
ncbi:hypothetical protein GALMADRAFT_267467 [Galerina marginata CBS 339.88]|uniref:SCD domain-containing protein n=1 Tax=Galerina marginata (strain CBS 339.88) TaxID=685588 RepID=A0A067TE98_GALM3|nr:hypothetical protein GALMADRAFT_267467 [Galerina marginata CBS 339.88]